MLSFRNVSIAVVAVLAILAPVRAASAACVAITTASDLDHVRDNLAGSYCLKNDVSVAGISRFKPIGSVAQPFTGTFDGGGHVIRYVSLYTGSHELGLFGWITDGHVRDLTLAGVVVRSARAMAAGLVAGGLSGKAALTDVHATGTITCSATGCHVGGLVGETDPQTVILLSSSAAWVTAGNAGAAGGVVGQASGTINESYASGSVTCGSNCAVGGLVGFMEPGATVKTSFAVGPVQGNKDGSAGGLVGTGYGTILHSYATGAVQANGRDLIASLIAYHGGALRQDFAIGRVTPGTRSAAGGLIAVLATGQAATNRSYWDLTTTGQGTSPQGTGLSTSVLQANLPAGFDATWAITKGYSYPFLKNVSMPFASTLATVVKTGKVYTFLPLGQREQTEYATPPQFADRASLATAYTMIARAVGITDTVASLTREKIDQDFWHDATKKTTWAGLVTQHATLGSVVTLGADDTINDSNIIGPLKSRNVVLIRGQYNKSDTVTTDHWMLATLFTADSSNVTTALVANDPWTGQQVFIDPATRRVTRPANFPLVNFRVNGYRVVTLN